MELQILENLINCFSKISIKEVEIFKKRKQELEQKPSKSSTNVFGIEDAEERYYVETTLLNCMALNIAAQNGSIAINIGAKGKKALCKETWENLSEAEKQEVKVNEKVKNLDLESLTSKTQQEIKDTIQSNIIAAVKVAYEQAQRR